MSGTVPKVTILVPTYARAHFLSEALESAIGQTYPHLEILIFDDASPDETPRVAAAFAARDHRVRYFRHPENRGITGNWRSALGAASGEFVCILEDDDRFLPEFVERMVAPLRASPDLLLTFCDHWLIREDGSRDPAGTEMATRRFGRHSLPPGPVRDFVRTAVLDASIGITAAMFRTAYLSPEFIDDRAHGGIDLWLLYKCARTGRGAHYLPDRLMEYRSHPGGMSHSRPDLMGVGHVFVYEEALRDPTVAHLHCLFRLRLAHVAASRAIYLLASGETHEARALLRTSLRARPTMRAVAASALALAGSVAPPAIRFLRRAAAVLRILRGAAWAPGTPVDIRERPSLQ